MNTTLIAFLSLLATGTPHIPDSILGNQTGSAAAQTGPGKTMPGFGGWLVVTPDENWREKLQTSAREISWLDQSALVSRGDQLFVLTLFANAQLNERNEVNVMCDIRVVRPDGSLSMDQRRVTCARGQLRGPIDGLYLSLPVIGFTGEKHDPAGKWTVHITLEDHVSGISLPLTTSFVLEGE